MKCFMNKFINCSSNQHVFQKQNKYNIKLSIYKSRKRYAPFSLLYHSFYLQPF